MMDPQALLDLIRSRRSIRRFRDDPPPREVLDLLVEAARWAPTNHNRQGFRLVVLLDRQEIGRLASLVRSSLQELAGTHLAQPLAEELIASASWFGGAPVLVLVYHKRPVAVGGGLLEGTSHPELISGEPLSAAMAVENMLLVAAAQGLGACVLTAPLIAGRAFEGLGTCPPGHELTCLLALGWPAEEPEPPRRKRIDRIAEFRENR